MRGSTLPTNDIILLVAGCVNNYLLHFTTFENNFVDEIFMTIIKGNNENFVVTHFPALSYSSYVVIVVVIVKMKCCYVTLSVGVDVNAYYHIVLSPLVFWNMIDFIMLWFMFHVMYAFMGMGV